MLFIQTNQTWVLQLIKETYFVKKTKTVSRENNRFWRTMSKKHIPHNAQTSKPQKALLYHFSCIPHDTFTKTLAKITIMTLRAPALKWASCRPHRSLQESCSGRACLTKCIHTSNWWVQAKFKDNGEQIQQRIIAYPL